MLREDAPGETVVWEFVDFMPRSLASLVCASAANSMLHLARGADNAEERAIFEQDAKELIEEGERCAERAKGDDKRGG